MFHKLRTILPINITKNVYLNKFKMASGNDLLLNNVEIPLILSSYSSSVITYIFLTFVVYKIDNFGFFF